MWSERNEDLCHNLFVVFVVCAEFSKTLYIIDRNRIIRGSERERGRQQEQRIIRQDNASIVHMNLYRLDPDSGVICIGPFHFFVSILVVIVAVAYIHQSNWTLMGSSGHICILVMAKTRATENREKLETTNEISFYNKRRENVGH